MDFSISHRHSVGPDRIAAEHRRLGRTRRPELFGDIVLRERLDPFFKVSIPPWPSTAGQYHEAEQKGARGQQNWAPYLTFPVVPRTVTVPDHAGLASIELNNTSHSPEPSFQ